MAHLLKTHRSLCTMCIVHICLDKYLFGFLLCRNSSYVRAWYLLPFVSFFSNLCVSISTVPISLFLSSMYLLSTFYRYLFFYLSTFYSISLFLPYKCSLSKLKNSHIYVNVLILL